MTLEGIHEAQQAWGEGIVAMASAHQRGEDYVGIAHNHVETLYAYGMSPVLFKPTLAAREQFRPTFEQALSYFVASNGACPEDTGFAIKGWTKVRFENADIVIHETTALAMGCLLYTSPSPRDLVISRMPSSA